MLGALCSSLGLGFLSLGLSTLSLPASVCPVIVRRGCLTLEQEGA